MDPAVTAPPLFPKSTPERDARYRLPLTVEFVVLAPPAALKSPADTVELACDTNPPFKSVVRVVVGCRYTPENTQFGSVVSAALVMVTGDVPITVNDEHETLPLHDMVVVAISNKE